MANFGVTGSRVPDPASSPTQRGGPSVSSASSLAPDSRRSSAATALLPRPRWQKPILECIGTDRVSMNPRGVRWLVHMSDNAILTHVAFHFPLHLVGH